MNLFNLYALSDKERFPAYVPESDEKRPSTLFYADLKTAQAFGIRAVWETLKRCGDLHTRNPYEVTELYIVLNNLMWEIAESTNYAPPPPKSRAGKIYTAYKKRFDEIDEIARNEWTEDARRHFYLVTD